MIYSLMPCFGDGSKMITPEDIKPIYFKSIDLIKDFIEWFNQRVTLEVLDRPVPDGFVGTYKGITDNGLLLINIAEIACKHYTDQNVVYMVSVVNKTNGRDAFTDTYVDAKIATDMANLINANSDVYKASVVRVLVIYDEETLNTLKKYLTSSDDMAKYLSEFPSSEVIK